MTLEVLELIEEILLEVTDEGYGMYYFPLKCKNECCSNETDELIHLGIEIFQGREFTRPMNTIRSKSATDRAYEILQNKISMMNEYGCTDVIRIEGPTYGIIIS